MYANIINSMCICMCTYVVYHFGLCTYVSAAHHFQTQEVTSPGEMTTRLPHGAESMHYADTYLHIRSLPPPPPPPPCLAVCTHNYVRMYIHMPFGPQINSYFGTESSDFPHCIVLTTKKPAYSPYNTVHMPMYRTT